MLSAAIAALLPLLAIQPPMPLPDLLVRMGTNDRGRIESIGSYTCLRRYTLVNRRFHVVASLDARMTYRYPGEKSFEILSGTGPAMLRDRVLRRMVEAERKASSDALRARTQITSRNYAFDLLDSETLNGRLCYVLRVTPLRYDKYLMRGRIWLDAADLAIVRVESSPAVNPSVLIRDTRIVQQYEPVSFTWLPLFNHSESDSFLFGRTEVTIDSSAYKVIPRPCDAAVRGAGATAVPACATQDRPARTAGIAPGARSGQ